MITAHKKNTFFAIFKSLLIFFLFLAIAHTTWISFMIEENGLNQDERYFMPKMLTYKADSPYVYRTLMPSIINSITKITQGKLFKVYEKYYWKEKLDKELELAHIDPLYSQEWVIFSWISILSFTFFGITLKPLILEFYDVSLPIAYTLSLLSVALLPAFFGPSFMYDPFSILLPILLFYALIKERLFIYYFLFILMTFNRETSIFFLLIFLSCNYKKINYRNLIIHTILHFIIYACIIFTLHKLIQNTSGTSVIYQLINNIIFIKAPSYKLLSLFIRMVCILFLVFYEFKHKPPLLARSLITYSIPVLVLYILFGRLLEIRIFLEIYFLICLLAVPTLLKVFGSTKVIQLRT